MNLDRLSLFTVACTAMALACGCGSSATAKRVEAPTLAASEAHATTELNFAVVPGPSPRVGKSQRDSEAVVESEDAMDAPKEPRRTSSSRRSGGFGTWK